METIQFKTNIKCAGCIAKVTPVLNELAGSDHWQVAIDKPEKILTVSANGLTEEATRTAVEKAGFKAILIGIAILMTSLVACTNEPSKSTGENKTTADTSQPAIASNTGGTKAVSPIKELVDHYLHVKNALANDDGKDAAVAGKAIVVTMDKLDTSVLAPDQKKGFKDLQEDTRENAEHIGANADKIAHQREHFEMLSKDMYDLVKKFGAGQTVYQDFCPMYNEGKGATWISETKDIKNPYLGKKMPTCGSVKEEIK